MAEDFLAINALTHRTREVVGVFASADALEAGVNHLEASGFSRASISVLGVDDSAKDRIGLLHRKAAEIEDDQRAPRAAFVSKASRREREAAAVVIPLYVGGCAGAVAVVAFGGALAVAIAAVILGNAAGATLGGLLASVVARHRAKRIEAQLAQGGLILWLTVPNRNSEKRALDILKEAGAQDVHVHVIQGGTGAEGSSLAGRKGGPVHAPRSRSIAARPQAARAGARQRH